MAADLAQLGRAIAGDVLVPGAPAYEAVRKPAIARFHHIRPRAIVRCAGAGDVAEALAFARRSGLHAAPRSGGHCLAGRSSTAGLVIDVSPMNGVAVVDGLATVGAGTRLAELYAALERHGVTIPAGCGPTVGIAGLTLGGGFGILGRRHGLTCDRLVAAQVVLADGRVVDCDEHRDAELFWALRGAGGGQFGVVTSLSFATVPAPATTTFDLIWLHAAAAALIEAWQDWAPDAPDELTVCLRSAAAGDPARPPSVHAFGAMLGGRAETVALLGELIARAGCAPEAATYRHLPFGAAKQSLVGLGAVEDAPERALLQVGRSDFFRRPLPPEAIATLLALHAEGRRAGDTRELNFTPWGGAYNRVPAGATAFPHRDARFLVEHVLLADPHAPAGVQAWVERSWAALHPWATGGVYPNFPDPDLADPAAAYHGPNHDRLLRVKAAYDPDGVFRFPQSLAA